MTGTEYAEFSLSIERVGEGLYRARVLESPAGPARSDFSLPFAPFEVDNFILRFGRTRRGVRRLESPEMQAAKEFGGRLFKAVFTEEVQSALRSSLDQARREGRGLRLSLRLSDAPELVNLPWEYLYNPALNRFLSLSSKTPIVRSLDLPEPALPLGVKPPLRVLVMISSPSDYPALDVEHEWQNLKEALGELERRSLVVLDRLERATQVALQHKLRKMDYHVFHFIGHGGFDEAAQDGLLLLEDESGRSRPLSGQYLGAILHDEDTLRLAVLNACEGARTGLTDPFAGAAQSLVQQGLAAVIAMQFEITDAAAITFAREFYSAIADGYPVDAALAEARKGIFAMGNDVEWGTPVLYMSLEDGRVFDVAATAETLAAPVHTPVEVEVEPELPPPLETRPAGWLPAAEPIRHTTAVADAAPTPIETAPAPAASPENPLLRLGAQIGEGLNQVAAASERGDIPAWVYVALSCAAWLLAYLFLMNRVQADGGVSFSALLASLIAGASMILLARQAGLKVSGWGRAGIELIWLLVFSLVIQSALALSPRSAWLFAIFAAAPLLTSAILLQENSAAQKSPLLVAWTGFGLLSWLFPVIVPVYDGDYWPVALVVGALLWFGLFYLTGQYSTPRPVKTRASPGVVAAAPDAGQVGDFSKPAIEEKERAARPKKARATHPTLRLLALLAGGVIWAAGYTLVGILLSEYANSQEQVPLWVAAGLLAAIGLCLTAWQAGFRTGPVVVSGLTVVWIALALSMNYAERSGMDENKMTTIFLAAPLLSALVLRLKNQHAPVLALLLGWLAAGLSSVAITRAFIDAGISAPEYFAAEAVIVWLVIVIALLLIARQWPRGDQS